MKFMSFLFHRIVDNIPYEWMEISKDTFDEFMHIVSESSLPVVKIDDMRYYPSNGSQDKFISITFDDGWESDYIIAFPILNKYGFKATFFITTGWLNKKGYVNEGWLKEMAEYGMEIGSHTVSHRYLTRLPDKEIYEEFYKSKAYLEDLLGREVVSVSIPGGEYNKRILEMAKKAGYKMVATSKPGINYENSAIINRISIHAKTSVKNFRKIVSFSSAYIYQMQFLYFVRFLIKKAFGVDNYMKIKNWVIRKNVKMSNM